MESAGEENCGNSELFVPACVARKPNMESLKYGFVAFRSEEEKEVSSYYSVLCNHRHQILVYLLQDNYLLLQKVLLDKIYIDVILQ